MYENIVVFKRIAFYFYHFKKSCSLSIDPSAMRSANHQPTLTLMEQQLLERHMNAQLLVMF